MKSLIYLISFVVILFSIPGCATIEGIIEVETPLGETVYISPAIADGRNDELIIPLNVFPDPKIIIRGFRFTVTAENGESVYLYENSIPVPKRTAGKKVRAKTIDIPKEILWNGKNMDGVFVEDGIYSYFAEAWDGFGNTGRTPDSKVIVDNTPPVSTVSAPYLLFSPNGDGLKDILIIEHSDSSFEDLWTGTLLDMNQKEIKERVWFGRPEEFLWEGSGEDGTAADDGSYIYVLSSSDKAGNAFSADLSGIIIDTRPTPITLTCSDRYFSPNNDGIKDSISFTPFLEKTENIVNWNCDIIDENQLVKKSFGGKDLPPTSIIYDGSTNENGFIAEGSYKAVLTVLYKNGNLPEAETGLFTVDTSPPVINMLCSDIELFSPDGDGNKDFVTIKQDTSFENLWVGRIIDSKNKTAAEWVWQGKAGDFKWFGRNREGIILPDGSYRYVLSSEDPAGNRIEKTAGLITLDARATPVSVITNTAYFSPNSDGKKDTITIQPVIDIKEGITEWKLEIQDAQKNSVKSFNGSGFPPSAVIYNGKTEKGTTSADGSYQGILNVKYSKGNIATGYTANFIIDTSRPQITASADTLIFSPNGDGRKDSLKINQSGSIEDLWEGIIQNAYGDIIWKESWRGKPLPFSWSGRDSAGKTVRDGTYIYKISATDRAGNYSTFQIGNIIIDNRTTPVAVSTAVKSFSPNGDGIKDTIEYTLSVTVPDGITNWFVSIIDNKGQPWRTFSEKGTPPSRITWNGIGSNGRIIESDYYAEFTVEYEKGDVSRARTSSTSFIDVTPPSLTSNITPVPFSPDGDGIEDELTISLAVKDRSPISQWRIEILDPYRKYFKRFQGQGMPDSRILWNGRSSTNELVQSAEDYPVIISVEDSLGNKAVLEKNIAVDILVFRDGDKLKIIISSIYFKPYTADFLDRTAIDPERVDKNIATLNRLSEILKKYQEYAILLEGHAVRIYWDDPVKGPEEETEVLLPLSLDRANAIKKALAERGVKEERINTAGYGGTQPVVPHSDLDNRWKNRRVEFILIK